MYVRSSTFPLSHHGPKSLQNTLEKFLKCSCHMLLHPSLQNKIFWIPQWFILKFASGRWSYKLDYTLNGHWPPLRPFGSFTKLSVLFYFWPGGPPRRPNAFFHPFLMKTCFWSKSSDTAFGVANSILLRLAASVTVIGTSFFSSTGGTNSTECEDKNITLPEGFPHILWRPLFHMS